MLLAPLLIVLLRGSVLVQADYGPIAVRIRAHQREFETAAPLSLLDLHKGPAGLPQEGGDIVGATYLDRLGEGYGRRLEDDLTDYINYSIPQHNDLEMRLQLFRAQIFIHDAKVCLSDDNCHSAGQGIHYWGIVTGHPTDSLAAVSLSESEISAMITL